MPTRPEFLSFDVGGPDQPASLGALAWAGISGAPTVLAVHGITANAWAWDPVAHHLHGAGRVVALDLRGRGRSFEAPGPFGIRRHADDVADVVDRLGGPVTLVGHSMGAFVVEMTAERHPGLVDDVILVDGGAPLPLPQPPPATDAEIDALLDASLGPAIERLRTVWPDRVTYHAMWAQHPAYVDGIGPDLERNLLADLVEVDGGFRTAVDETAVRVDGRDLLADHEVRTLLDRRPPTTIVRAEFGLFGEPPPLIPDDVRARYAGHRWVEATGLNHYTVITSPEGAALVADTIRSSLVAR